MQNIEYKELPSPHVRIENFLSIPASKECLAEAQALEYAFQPAGVGGTHRAEDGSEVCEVCDAEDATHLTGIRQNDVVYMDTHYKNRRHESKILGHLQTAMQNTSLLNVFQELPYLFPIILQTTYMETILSSYGMCDFYGWHKDALDHMPAQRIITCVLHWNTEPQQFEGGELILSGKTIQDRLPYAPVHNTAIFFQSNQCTHAVDATVHEGDFKDSRFSINLWLGFEGDGDVGRYR